MLPLLLATLCIDPGPISDTGSTDLHLVGRDQISAWTEDFAGTFTRSWVPGPHGVQSLTLTLDQTAGGLDAGVGRSVYPGRRVDGQSIETGVAYRANVDLTGEGYWWLGPKTVISSTPTYTTLDGEYECYIVDDAKLSPADLAARIGATERGSGIYSGSVYRHYTVRWREINQVWSIRQDYRREGFTSVGYIQADWRKLGLVPNDHNLGWKLNIETNGANRGSVTFDKLTLPSPN